MTFLESYGVMIMIKKEHTECEEPLIETSRADFTILERFATADEAILKLAQGLIIYRDEYCINLEKRIREVIDYLCKFRDSKSVDLCDEQFQKLTRYLCKLYRLFLKYCCRGCCAPKDPVIDAVSGMLKAVTYDLVPGHFSVDDGLDLQDFDITNLQEITDYCSEVKDIVMESLKYICKFRNMPLCGDNELTRGLLKLCKIYPAYYQKCCL